MKKTIIIIAVIVMAYLGFWYLSIQESKKIPEQESQGTEKPDSTADDSVDDQIIPAFSIDKAFEIARENKDCQMAGVLTDDYFYNQSTKTWWINLERMPELEKDGCNPACVVSEETETAEVNWRCTGLIPPNEKEEVFCTEEQRGADACIEIYDPVCAKVNVQCIKAPCPPVKETFSNSCHACRNSLVESYVAGECDNN